MSDDQEQDPEKPDRPTPKPPWRDPGEDDTGLREQSPESLFNKMLRRND